MSVVGSPSPVERAGRQRRETTLRRTIDLALGLVLPLAATFLTFRFLLPSRFAAGTVGARAWLARLADEQPLLVGLALYAGYTAVGRYWSRRLEARMAGGEVAVAVAPPRAGRRFVAALVALAVVVVAARASVVAIHRVAGASMAPTLNDGDRLLVNRLAYGVRLPFAARPLGSRLPRRGDVVVFPNRGYVTSPGAPAALVKRVIGLPGDVVSYREGTPIVNGRAVARCDAGPFLVVADGVMRRGRLVVETLDGRPYLTFASPDDRAAVPDITVGPGQLFVVGDDRPGSEDSRSWRDRGVPSASLEGRVARLAFGRLRDGRLDLTHPLASLGLTVRDARIDVAAIAARVAACLAR